MWLLVVNILLLPVILFSQEVSLSEQNAQFFGFFTLLPPILAIICAFLTRQVLFSLFVGIWSGTFLLSMQNGFQIWDIFQSFSAIPHLIIDSMANSANAGIILQVLTIGGLIAVIARNGGARAVAEIVASKAKTPRSAQLLSWFLGLFIFFDDYANCLITGPVMKTVTDKLKVSREKLAFIVDATAAPISGIVLISTWIGYELGVMKDAYTIAGYTDINVYNIFIETIPYRFYNIFILGFIVLIALLNRDFGPMLKAERNARHGIIDSSGDQSDQDTSLDPLPGIKMNPWNALIPILVLIGAAIIGFWVNGYNTLLADDPEALSNLSGYLLLIEVLGNADAGFVIFQAALFASFIAFFMSDITKTVSLFDSIKIWVNGAKALFASAVIILLLAWSMASVIKELGAHYYLTAALKEILNPKLLPTIIFILGFFISFSTGTAFGTMGILMPLTIPLAISLAPDMPAITVSSAGAVLTGAIVGDHCSPISDTTILSAVGADCALLDHVRTQMPYALLVMIISIVFGYLGTSFGLPVFLAYVLGFSSLTLVLLTVGKQPNL